MVIDARGRPRRRRDGSRDDDARAEGRVRQDAAAPEPEGVREARARACSPPSPAFYPLTFTYAGEAEAPEGKADVIDVKGEGDFAVRLFVDQKTHMPLMLSWMDKEPLVMTMTSGGPGGAQTRDGGRRRQRDASSGGGGGRSCSTPRSSAAAAAARPADDARAAREDDGRHGGPPEGSRGEAAHGRVPRLLRRLPGRERRAAAAQDPALDRRQADRGDGVRPAQGQPEDRRQEVPAVNKYRDGFSACVASAERAATPDRCRSGVARAASQDRRPRRRRAHDRPGRRARRGPGPARPAGRLGRRPDQRDDPRTRRSR